MVKNSRHKTDIVSFKVIDWIKGNNKDMIPQYEELEKQQFKGHKKAYFYICENFGSSFFSCVNIYFNGDKGSSYNLQNK